MTRPLREEPTLFIWADSALTPVLNYNNEEIQQENANKNPTIISVQRDYMAGEVSKWYARERLFDNDLIEAHNNGIIHIHKQNIVA